MAAVFESEQHSRVTRRLRFVLEIFQLPRQAEVQEQPQLAAQHDKEVFPMSERRLETLSLEAGSELRAGYSSKHSWSIDLDRFYSLVERCRIHVTPECLNVGKLWHLDLTCGRVGSFYSLSEDSGIFSAASFTLLLGSSISTSSFPGAFRSLIT